MPTAVTPDLAHAVRFSSVGSTAPVHMIMAHGSGPRTFFTNAGPPTVPAGNTFTRSQPSSIAWTISVTVPQPGLYGTPRRLQIGATSSTRHGDTMKSAPSCIYSAAVGASRIVPAPNAISGHSARTKEMTSLNTRWAPSPRFVNSNARIPPS